MRTYETIVIFEPALGEAQVIEEIKKIEQLLNSKNAQNISADNWGKKEISYFFGKSNIGFYVQIKFSVLECSLLAELTNGLRLNEKIMKFQTHLISSRKRKFKGSPNRKGQIDLENSEVASGVDY